MQVGCEVLFDFPLSLQNIELASNRIPIRWENTFIDKMMMMMTTKDASAVSSKIFTICDVILDDSNPAPILFRNFNVVISQRNLM